jgi:hypothetical protein
MPSGGQLRSEAVEYVSRLAASGEKNHRPSGATPIEHLQLNVLFDAHESCAMRRWITPLGGTLSIKLAYKEGAEEKTDQLTLLRHTGSTPFSTKYVASVSDVP